MHTVVYNIRSFKRKMTHIDSDVNYSYRIDMES